MQPDDRVRILHMIEAAEFDVDRDIRWHAVAME